LADKGNLWLKARIMKSSVEAGLAATIEKDNAMIRVIAWKLFKKEGELD